MSTQETPLSAFFSSYGFEGYAYDPSSNPDDEFERLCTARRWGEAKKNKNLKKYRLALQENSSSPVDAFFHKYRVPHFTRNPLANQQTEFGLLQDARKWKGTKLEGVRKEFGAALESRVAPIVVFLRGQEVSGYRYNSGRAEIEFKRLVGAHRRIWEQKESKIGRDVKGREGRRWRASTEFSELQEGFYSAVEEQFRLMLDEIARKTVLRRDEVLAELFCVGMAPLSEKEAEALLTGKQRALESVHVNVFDFLHEISAAVSTATEFEKGDLIQLLSPIVCSLSFSSKEDLSVYSALSSRAFPSRAQQGELIPLLRRICQNLDGLKGGNLEGLADAIDDGSDAVREFFLSGVRVPRNCRLPGH